MRGWITTWFGEKRLQMTAACMLAAGMALGGSAFAREFDGDDELDEIVVTATRTETPVAEVGSSVTVITADEIERSRQSSVVELLRDVPAVDVVRTGSYGSSTTVFIRGAKSEQTLVLIDGIEINDPMGLGRGANLAHLTTDNIERIEVVRGPQSTLYGSDALGGVINVITKKGSGPPTATISIEGGTHSTFREAVTAAGGTEVFDYSVSLSRFDTEGISSASEAFGNTEKDGYSNTTFSGSLGWAPAEGTRINVLLRYVDAETEIDDGAGAGNDDPDRVFLSKQIIAGTKAKFGLPGDRWRQSVGLAFTNFHRDDVDPGESTSDFDGRLLKGDWQGDFVLNDTNKLTFGIEHEIEKGESTWTADSDARTTGVFVQDQMGLGDTLFATLGARTDSHDRFGTHATYRAAVSVLPAGKGTKISATVGSGFKAPSLNQLAYNQDLEPEELTAFDVGLEQRFREGDVAVAATYFRNDFTNLIKWDGSVMPGTYNNIGGADAEGVELAASLKTEAGFSIRATYTYTDATEDGLPAIRRPKEKAGLHIGYRARRGGDISMSLAYFGETDDLDFSTWPATPVTLSRYTLVGITASCRVGEKIEVFGRIDNLLDEDYLTAYGFGTPGLTVIVGTKASF
jgi:vitamin B12 transporter